MAKGKWKLSTQHPKRVLYVNRGDSTCPCVVYRIHNDGPADVFVDDEDALRIERSEDIDVSGQSISVALHTRQKDVTVTAKPLWTDTSIDFAPGETWVIWGATGTWSWGVNQATDADGDPTSVPLHLDDEWIRTGRHGQLIAAVLPAGQVPNALPQNDPHLFVVGKGTVQVANNAGHLWLGFNDDRVTDAINDNSGSQRVSVALSQHASGSYELVAYCCGSSCGCGGGGDHAAPPAKKQKSRG